MRSGVLCVFQPNDTHWLDDFSFLHTWRHCQSIALTLAFVNVFERAFCEGHKENLNATFSSVLLVHSTSLSHSLIFNFEMDFFKKLSLRFQNKTSSAAVPVSTKSPLTLDSDISGIDGEKNSIKNYFITHLKC